MATTTGFFPALDSALKQIDMLRQRSSGGSTSPTGPVTQQQSKEDDGFGPRPGGGGTTGGTGTGTIKGPTFGDSAGDIGIAPEGYEPVTGFPGYYYNPDTNSVRIMTDTSFDPNGTPVAKFRALTKAEDTAFRKAYATYAAQQGLTDKGGGVPGVDKSMTDYEKAQVGLAQQRLAEEQRAQRVAEAKAAIDALVARQQAAQQSKLDALPYVAGNMQYFPGFGPSSPTVSMGLADPVKVQGVAFDPNQIMNIDSSHATQDLAAIRQMAGYG